MKSKLRKIVVCETTYLYSIKEFYTKDSNESEGNWTTVLRVFKREFKSTPFELVFLTKDLYAEGNPLKSNHSVIRNGETHSFNIYRPWIISLLIEGGIQLGWDGSSKLRIEQGNSLLREIGFDLP